MSANKKDSRAKARKFKLSIVILLLLGVLLSVLAIWLLFLNPLIMKQKAQHELDAEYGQLQLVYNDFISTIPQEKISSTETPKKICSQQSVEIGRGTIRCSITFNVVASNALNLRSYSELLRTILNKQRPNISSVSDVNYVITTSPKGEGGQFTFKSISNDLDCGAWSHSYIDSDTVNIIAWCGKDVADFLPDYTIK